METVEIEMSKKRKTEKSEAAQPTTLRITDELKERIEQLADQEGRTFSEVCRELMEKAVADGNPSLQRGALLQSVLRTTVQFEAALKGGALKDTEADEDHQAGEIRKFLGQFVALLKGNTEADDERS